MEPQKEQRKIATKTLPKKDVKLNQFQPCRAISFKIEELSLKEEYERLKKLNSKKIKGFTTNLINSLCKDFNQFTEICQGRLSNYENAENEVNPSDEIFKENN